MEIISLNTSLFSMRKMHGATCIVAKLQHDHKISYVIGKHVIDVQSRSDLILS